VMAEKIMRELIDALRPIHPVDRVGALALMVAFAIIASSIAAAIWIIVS
jgi:hypothetical protein